MSRCGEISRECWFRRCRARDNDVQSVSLQQRACYGLETVQYDIASGHAQDAYSFGDFVITQMSGREDLFDAFFDGFELCVEQAGLNVRQQLL
jgi:hypothetical protein